jgi:hypothetical protein
MTAMPLQYRTSGMCVSVQELNSKTCVASMTQCTPHTQPTWKAAINSIHPPSTGPVVATTPALTCLHCPCTHAPGIVPLAHCAPFGAETSPAHSPVVALHVRAPHIAASVVQLVRSAARKHFCGVHTPVVLLGVLTMPSPQMRHVERCMLRTCSQGHIWCKNARAVSYAANKPHREHMLLVASSMHTTNKLDSKHF